ncbi:MAG: DNA polymerase III subunit [Puniceicoccales bacterium]|jgi:DNA polymerase-3 subunit delta'|nr:DNA polymerase III subunit [Puniceicoccales bacterium]
MNYNATETLLRAVADNRLPHGILLYGADADALREACLAIVAQLLDTSIGSAPSHPDFHTLSPSNKSRRISIDETRHLIHQIQQTPRAGARKVAVIHDADRLMHDSAHAFLKTLEEPPADCTIFLLTSKPARLLDTIRSRCLLFHIQPGEPKPDDLAWTEWKADLDAWLEELTKAQKIDRARAANLIFSAYGLATRFGEVLGNCAAAKWAERKAALSPEIEDEQKLAIESGIRKDISARFYADMAGQLRENCARRPSAASVHALHLSLAGLERSAGLQEVNLKEESAIEYTLLQWLRVWSAARARE